MPPAAVVRLRTTTTRHEQGQLLELAVECGANRRTCSASPVASRCADGSDKPKLRLACRFELSDAFSALRLPPNAVATVSGPTVRHPEIVTRLQRVAFFLKVSTQMRPADLSTGRLDPLIRAEPVTADYLIVFASQESRGDFAAKALGDRKNCVHAGHRGPQPSLLAILTPRRLVDINHLGMMDRSREFVVRDFKGLR
jgi:hypothetical protein